VRVLLAEDDQKISEMVAAALEENGFLVDTESDGEEIWFKGDTEDYAAIILDLGLPNIDGLSILKKWRANGRKAPILVLTARGTWSERVEGIDAGADDYLAKPFEMDELLARLRAILRRSGGHAAPNITIGNVLLDRRQMRVSVSDVPILLTPQEFRLVAYLMHKAGQVVTQQELAEHLQAEHFDRESNAVEVIVGRARKKLGANLIETRRGFGYIFANAAA
jgi:two-component system, OmpR family, response regulator